jgi:hypothetical protein
VTDFESTFKRLLNENVDAALGPRRPAPRLGLSAAAGRRRFRPWVAPLVIAACVVAALIATVTTTNVLSEHRAATPGSTTPAPSPTVIRLADASIWLPPGWRATVSSHGPSNKFPDVGNQSTTWCLGPAGTGSTGSTGGTCRVWLERSVQDPVHGNIDGEYDPDVPGGTPHSHVQLCPDANRGWSMLDAGERVFGGRTANYGVFELQCGSGPKQQITQYLVPAGPAFELYAESGDSALRTTVAEIAQHSTLPKQTSAVRYYDHGYVRSLKSVAGHIEFTIDRVTTGPKGPVNSDPRTYLYVVSAGTWSIENLHPTAVGQLATVETDGTTVFEVSQVPR